MIRVTTGRDFGCPMTEDDIDSYITHVERRLGDIYHTPAHLDVTGNSNTKCLDWPDGVDPREVERFVGVELWDEWCAKGEVPR